MMVETLIAMAPTLIGIDPAADEKTSGDRNGNQIINCRLNEILDHLSVSSA
jgi:hypothetical protein